MVGGVGPLGGERPGDQVGGPIRVSRQLHPTTLHPPLVAFLGGGGFNGEDEAAHPRRQLTGGLSRSPLQHQGNHLLGFLVGQGGHLIADHPDPGQVDQPAAERIGQLWEPSQLQGQLQQQPGRPSGESRAQRGSRRRRTPRRRRQPTRSPRWWRRPPGPPHPTTRLGDEPPSAPGRPSPPPNQNQEENPHRSRPAPRPVRDPVASPRDRQGAEKVAVVATTPKRLPQQT